jgi:hypothetical protein
VLEHRRASCVNHDGSTVGARHWRAIAVPPMLDQ